VPQKSVAPALQTPAPLQPPARFPMFVPAGQLWTAPHAVPPGQYEQLPAPSHLPVVPQVVEAEAAQSLACAVLAETSAHVPSAWPVYTFAHAWHFDAHAFWQQTPSTQAPVAHSVDVVQPWPCGRPTHVLLALQIGVLAGQSGLEQQLGSAAGMQALPHTR
jgi:hypothetical protein